MKSIVEQASSIAKAIEKGWERAGNPSNFTVKILEQPEKNFFGMTTKSAKIAIFFEEAKATQWPARRQSRGSAAQAEASRARHIQKTEKQVLSSVEEHKAESAITHKAPAHHSSQQSSPQTQPAPSEPVPVVDVWNSEMIAIVENWLRTTFKIMNSSNVTFSANASGRYLTIIFDKPIYENKKKQRLLFSSFAHLIMETLRSQFKTDIRGARIVLKSE